MCGRFILVQKIERIAERFNVNLPENFTFNASYIIAPGSFVPVIANNNSNVLQSYQFGLTPSWAKKPMYLFKIH